MGRMQWMVTFGSYWLGVETVLRDSVLRKWALGWRFAAVFGLAQVYGMGLNYLVGSSYAPLMGAYLRKYSHFATSDAFEIQDEKREFY